MDLFSKRDGRSLSKVPRRHGRSHPLRRRIGTAVGRVAAGHDPPDSRRNLSSREGEISRGGTARREGDARLPRTFRHARANSAYTLATRRSSGFDVSSRLI